MIIRKSFAAALCLAAPLLFAQRTPESFKIFTNAGTSNWIAKFASDGTTVVNSAIFESGGYVGINTSNPLRILTVDVGHVPDNGIRIARALTSTYPYVDFTLVTSAPAPYAALQVGDALTWRALALQPNGGNVGIRTTIPGAPLHVYGGATAAAWAAFGPDPNGPSMTLGHSGDVYGPGAAFINAMGGTGVAAPNPSLRFLTGGTQRMILTNTGQLGVNGTPGYAHTVDVYALQWGNAVRAIDTAPLNQGFGAGYTFAVRYNTAGDYADVASIRGGRTNPASGDRNGKMQLQVADQDGNPKTVVELMPTNMVFHGNAHFNGAVTGTTISATYQDVAEWVPSSSDLEPGTVVVLDPALGNGVRASHGAYDTSVAGVISAAPGIILGVAGAEKEQVATTGRVMVRVDASNGPIAVGDLLVTSDRPGLAMRSVPVDVNGVRMHRPGTIVGKALQPLASGQGEILVLLSLQ